MTFLFIWTVRDATNLDDFCSIEAKELRALMEKHWSILVGESVLFEKLKFRLAERTSAISLVLTPESNAMEWCVLK